MKLHVVNGNSSANIAYKGYPLWCVRGDLERYTLITELEQVTRWM